MDDDIEVKVGTLEKVDKRKTMAHLWQKGKSGNPKGRPKGSKNYANILAQDLLERNADAILKKIIDKALDGNDNCLRMCMDRLLPSKRAIDITKTETKDHEINIYVEKVEEPPALSQRHTNVIEINPLRSKEKV